MNEQPHMPIDAPHPGPSTRGRTLGPLALTYVIIAGILLVLVVTALHLGAWVYMQGNFAYDIDPGRWLWPGFTVVAGIFAAVVCVPILFMRRFPRLAAVGHAWLWAAVTLAVFGFTRLVPLPLDGPQLAVQAVAFGLVAVALWLGSLWRRRRGHAEHKPVTAPGALWWAACAGVLTVLPWAWLGAFGNGVEVVLAALDAVAFGAFTAFLLGDRFWRPFFESSSLVRVWGGAGACGVALVLAGGAVGGAGVQLPVMLVLGALCFPIAALQRRASGTGRVTAAAVAPGVFGPLAFMDADEFLPLTFGVDFGTWVALSAAVAVVVAWALGVAYGVLSRRLVSWPAIGAGLVVVIVAAAGALNAFGQSGFHGEKLLVVMNQQADLSDVSGDREERLTQVHQRLIDTAESSQRSLRAELDERGLEWKPFYLVNAIEVDTQSFSRSWLSGRDDVQSVLLSPQTRPIAGEKAAQHGDKTNTDKPQPNIEQVAAPQAWKSDDGAGITIGISDSGVDGTHPALAKRFRGGKDSWADPVNGTTKPRDPDGHGTHALGLALGSKGIGVAPGADWMGCSNLPRNAGNPGDYLSCLQFMLAPYSPGGDPMRDGDPTRAPHVLTNSWGCPSTEGCDPRVFGPALRAFDAAGVFFSVAAGNSGPDCGSAKTPPANEPQAYAVGAVNSRDQVTSFSSRGPVTVNGKQLAKPDIAAPGDEVVSALPGGGYGPLSGTSMAAPHVAGAVAVLWSAEPKLVGDIDGTRDLLASTAEPITKAESTKVDECGANAAGAGRIDVAAALQKLD